MNNEQNEIEEMAKKLSDIMDGGMLEVDIDDIATALYNAGYCKVAKPVIKDGEVIGFINNGEYEYVPKALLTFAKGQARNDTAKEILQYVFDEAGCGDLGEFGDEGWIFTVDDANRIAKEYGIDLTEKE